jgi:hypothetical protein
MTIGALGAFALWRPADEVLVRCYGTPFKSSGCVLVPAQWKGMPWRAITRNLTRYRRLRVLEALQSRNVNVTSLRIHAPPIGWTPDIRCSSRHWKYCGMGRNRPTVFLAGATFPTPPQASPMFCRRGC